VIVFIQACSLPSLPKSNNKYHLWATQTVVISSYRVASCAFLVCALEKVTNNLKIILKIKLKDA